MSVAVVEDEVMIAYDIQDILTELGVAVGAVYHTYEDAERGLDEESFDAVLLDLNLGGRMTTPLALKLRDRGVPTLIVSSYCKTLAQLEELRDIPSLPKPFSERHIKEALTEIGVLESLTSDSSSADMSASETGAVDAERNASPLLPPLRQRH